MEAQLDELTATYNQLCESSTQQLQQLEQQLAKEEERKVAFLDRCAIHMRCCRFVILKKCLSVYLKIVKGTKMLL